MPHFRTCADAVLGIDCPAFVGEKSCSNFDFSLQCFMSLVFWWLVGIISGCNPYIITIYLCILIVIIEYFHPQGSTCKLGFRRVRVVGCKRHKPVCSELQPLLLEGSQGAQRVMPGFRQNPDVENYNKSSSSKLDTASDNVTGRAYPPQPT